MKRKLGRSGIEVSALGIGGWAIGGPWHDAQTGEPFGWGDVDDQESIAAIHCAIDNGITFIDTSDNYGAGHSERVIGQALKGRRSEVTLATKFGFVTNEQTKEATGQNASRAYIKQACEASLRRLDTDYIDLYQFHLGDYPVHLAQEVLEVLEELVTEGKIRFFGWSTDLPDRARFFAQSPYCAAIQHDMNLFLDNAEMIRLCEKHHLASINRGPLAMGLLTGKYSDVVTVADPKDIRHRNDLDWLTYFKDGVPSSTMIRQLMSIRDILTSNGRTLTQGALAYLWARSETTLPIPGFRKVKQVTENAKALEFGPLTQTQVQQIQQLMTEQSIHSKH
ncbi:MULTISPECIES: aldo/keto reductase [unclassified Paenibacillus]|uniref:aldo/keto reductase n=1 Tax=unclassified Paenibacillus TaxID=185978 RepID=UPI00277D830A|nr:MULTISPECIES: aldo/keto reductase [unclassified Paenibacillus]MDQ0897678.1 aryl-alcohol dehydrogenase-like predicted oxidoreductase [Paenibacillus sp. V4I7]MDQ0916330.1 aryl-alcohol dehydrogenase-like predicted oxidoreductase [Paenibacillus sp. V4I5]